MPKIKKEFKNTINEENCERKFFTKENIGIIYERLQEETSIIHMPHLGTSIDYGMGDICLEETIKNNKPIYKLYVIDRHCKFNYTEFENIEDAITSLANMYVGYEIESNEEMINIFFETLHLTNIKKLKKGNLK